MKLTRILSIVANTVITVAAVLYLALEPRFGALSVVKRSIAERTLEKRAAEQWAQLRKGQARLGHPDGDVVLVEFADYECPYCRLAHQEVLDMLTENADAGVVLIHFPIGAIHPNAVLGARMAVCSEAEGRFDSMHHLLMTTNSWREGLTVDEVAVQAGLIDPQAFSECVESVETTERLAEDRRLATSLGITGTPTWIGGRGVKSGFASRVELGELLERPAQLPASIGC